MWNRITHLGLCAGLLIFMAGCGASTPKAESSPSVEAPSTVAPAPAPAPAAEETQAVQYFMGQTATTSPDESTPYGPPKALVARWVMNGSGDRIVEDTWHGGEHFRSVFIRRPNTLVFDVNDDGKVFSGTVTFAITTGKGQWNRSAMTYALKMLDGSGTVTGSAQWEDDVLKTNKVFSDPANVPKARIRDSLQVITKDEFDAIRASKPIP